MNALTDLIQRCHQRHRKPRRQRKTIITPALYKSWPYHVQVHCSRRNPLMLDALEAADISFMPIGHAAENDRGPKDRDGDRFLKRQGAADWQHHTWAASWGIQIYTGTPSAREGAPWHDIHFTYQAICAAPDAVLACVAALVEITPKALLTVTKSGGLRFSCRILDYLHPNTDAARSYIYKHAPTPEKTDHRDVYVEIVGANSYSRWDARYDIRLGDLLDPPVITKELLFVPIDALRAALHAPSPSGIQPAKTEQVAPASLGSENLDLAKEAFLARGFSYLQQDEVFHHYIYTKGNSDEKIYAWLWEDHETVWGRASVPISGLHIRGMPITDIWDDTGIPEPTSTALGIPGTEKVREAQEGKRSPLAIKRPKPLLSQAAAEKKVYGTLKERTAQLQRASEMDARVIGINTEIGTGTDYDAESYIRSGDATGLNVPSDKAQITPVHQLFLDPQHTPAAEHILDPIDETERTCIIDASITDKRKVTPADLFLECELPKSVLEAWEENWRGQALSYFAKALSSAVELQNHRHDTPVTRVRAVVQAFQQHEAELIRDMCTVGQNPEWTVWHQLKRFFAHYTRDADAPMLWTGTALKFYVPPILHPKLKRLLLISPTLSEPLLRRAFPDEDIEFVRTEPTAWVPGNRVFQLRTGIHSHHTILNDDGNWDVPCLSKTGEHFFLGIRADIERDPSVSHAIITHEPITKLLADLTEKENVRFIENFEAVDGADIDFEAVQVVWIVGTPHCPQSTIWRHTQMLFGADEAPLHYEGSSVSGHYKDGRVQSVYHQHVGGLLTRIIGQIGLNRWGDKRVLLLTGIELPDITDRPETLLFDWADFDVAAGLDKLPDTIATRQRLESERENITAETRRKEVERILGCPSRQANRILKKLRGGNLLRIPFREQICTILADGETTTKEFIEKIEGNPQAIKHELARLVAAERIVRIRRGVYILK